LALEVAPHAEAGCEDLPAGDHPPVDGARQSLQRSAGVLADDTVGLLAALERVDELVLVLAEGGRHRRHGVTVGSGLQQPRDEQGVAQAGVQCGGAGEKRVRERVADTTETEVVDGALVAELVHGLHHAAPLLGVDGEPAEGGGHLADSDTRLRHMKERSPRAARRTSSNPSGPRLSFTVSPPHRLSRRLCHLPRLGESLPTYVRTVCRLSPACLAI